MASSKDEMAGSSGADVSSVTMVDVLNEQAVLDAESDIVLGRSDEKNCTYSEVGSSNNVRVLFMLCRDFFSQVYIGRQALYACLTCIPE